ARFKDEGRPKETLTPTVVSVADLLTSNTYQRPGVSVGEASVSVALPLTFVRLALAVPSGGAGGTSGPAAASALTRWMSIGPDMLTSTRSSLTLTGTST